MPKKTKKGSESTPTASTPAATATPTATSTLELLESWDLKLKFANPADTADTADTIILPGWAFFDQNLWEVIFNKLMKAPVKDYQVLLRMSKLWKTVNEISSELTKIRDAITKDCWLESEALSLTPEMLNSAEYQEKTKNFWALIQEHVFKKFIDLAPLWSLTLDLTAPDWHAKAFLEWSNLSTDDIELLEGYGIIKIVFPEE